MKFEIIKTDKKARAGLLSLNGNTVETPTFMPVATRGTIKSTPHEYLNKTSILLANAYHLHLRPGPKIISDHGGLHKFMNCDLPILTDSGGFQVMSLSKLNKIDREKGAIFNSHVDGKKFFLSPEESIKIQLGLNSDIVMIMDECPKKTNDYKKGATILMRSDYLNKFHTESKSIAKEKVGDLYFDFPAGSFFQNNPFILKEFTEHVKYEAKCVNSKYLVDAYCGAGLFALTSASNFDEVTGIEISEEASLHNKFKYQEQLRLGIASRIASYKFALELI